MLDLLTNLYIFEDGRRLKNLIVECDNTTHDEPWTFRYLWFIETLLLFDLEV